MTISIDSQPDIERRITDEAKRSGLSVDALVQSWIEEKVAEQSDPIARSSSDWRVRREAIIHGPDSLADLNMPILSDEMLRREQLYDERV